MSSTPSHTECADCGALIDTAADTPDSCVPCAKCGGVRRIVHASMGEMRPTNYLLDNFVAHKLSLLNECGAAELPAKANWLTPFILSSVFRVSLPSKMRAYVFNFLRRADGASSAYREARVALIEYVETPRNVLSPYFTALLNFEVCISQCYQGYKLLATALREKFFEPNDGSEGERLWRLYNDCKHMDSRIDDGEMPTEATAAVWITNNGLESSQAALSFDELLEMLLNMGRLAERLLALVPPTANPALNTDEPTSGAPT